ncbi:hypothetical protein KR018_000701 [Drosophila ironensis]|nr:hypothetical protein KR018_000701 [Drosophila ironensis]
MSHFGAEVDELWPPLSGEDCAPLTAFGRRLLGECVQEKPPQPTDQELDGLVAAVKRKSRKFPLQVRPRVLPLSNLLLIPPFLLQFGVDSVRIERQALSNISEQIASTYPVIHERTLFLYLQYLEHKCLWGNSVEQGVYKDLSLCGLVQRLLEKRCASFFARNDKYLLLSGERGASGFEAVGTPLEKAPLLLASVLSYDDIKLSALLSVSSQTIFVNEGERTNCGRVGRGSRTLQPSGVIVGMIGARLSRRNLMEFQDIVVARTQNTRANGYGQALGDAAQTREQDYRRLWRGFYAVRDLVHGEASIDQQRFGPSGNKQDVFDNLVMKRRYAVSFDLLLLETQARAEADGRLAYLHVVGFGLGVWKVAGQQERIFLEAFEQRLRALGSRLDHIGAVHFSWFKLEKCGGLRDGALIPVPGHPNGGVRVLLSKRRPAEKLTGPVFADMLLVVSYAWDGNALPGNEFWMKMLKSTGDSSTACSTLVAELHNPHINSEFCCGRNLHIAAPDLGVLHVSEYARRVLRRGDDSSSQAPAI